MVRPARRRTLPRSVNKTLSIDEERKATSLKSRTSFRCSLLVDQVVERIADRLDMRRIDDPRGVKPHDDHAPVLLDKKQLFIRHGQAATCRILHRESPQSLTQS